MEFSIEGLKSALNSDQFNARNFIYKATGKVITQANAEVEAFEKMVTDSDLPGYLKEALLKDVKKPCHKEMTEARQRYVQHSIFIKPGSGSKKAPMPVKHRKYHRKTYDEITAEELAKSSKKRIKYEIFQHIRRVIAENWAVRHYYDTKLPEALKAEITASAFYQRVYNTPDKDKIRQEFLDQQEATRRAAEKAEADRIAAEQAEADRIAEEKRLEEEAEKAKIREQEAAVAEANAKAFRKALRDIEALDKIEEIPRIKEYVSDIDLAIRRHVQVNIESIKTDIDVLNTKLNAIMRALNVTVPSTLEPISRESKMTSQEYHKREEDLPSWGDYQRSKHQQRR